MIEIKKKPIFIFSEHYPNNIGVTYHYNIIESKYIEITSDFLPNDKCRRFELNKNAFYDVSQALPLAGISYVDFLKAFK